MPYGCHMDANQLKDSIDDRFADYIFITHKGKNAILATCFHPKYKINTIQQYFSQEAVKKIEKDCISELIEEHKNELKKEPTIDPDDNQVSWFLEHRHSLIDEEQIKNYAHTQFHSFNHEADTVENLKNNYPFIKKCFIKFNTPLPSSADVERLFSIANYFLNPRRSLMRDDVINMSMVLKENQDYLDFTFNKKKYCFYTKKNK